jgi:hypothetical protein
MMMTEKCLIWIGTIIIMGSYIALNPEGTSSKSAFQAHHHYAPVPL